MTASLQPITNLTVPAQQGYTLPLLASSTAPDPQTFTVTSSNPAIAASIAQGPFWNLAVNYTDPTTPANSVAIPFTGTLTFQLFQTLTPNTVTEITNLTNAGDFVSSYQYFYRIATGFPNATDYVVEGGSPTLTGEETSPPVTFANENLQQLAFTGTDQLGMANTGGTDSNTTKFFITTGSPNAELGYDYTIFGQLVAGQNTLAQMTQVPVMQNAFTGETSEPDNPITVTSATLTNTNPNGVAIIDTTQATPGETSTITVTATDSVDHTTTSQSFTVTVGAYAGPTSSALLGNVNFKPLASPVSTPVTMSTAATVQLAGTSGDPDQSTPGTLNYVLVSQPTHGTISNFSDATGTFTYTPTPGFAGTDTFQYDVESIGPNSSPAIAISNAATVTISVTPIVPPLVTLSKVELVENHEQQVVKVIMFFSGALDMTEADKKTTYRLTTQGKDGSYTARNARIIQVRKAVYSAAGDSVTLKPAAPFSLRKSVQLLIHGTAPGGLQDSLGRYIDGADNGQPGSDAIAILSRKGVML
jgi:cyclophilin family peptidyl-prolyl cis-trans isomerase